MTHSARTWWSSATAWSATASSGRRRARADRRRYDVVVLGEEPRPAYDRVALTSFFYAESADELSLLPGGWYDDPRVRLRLGTGRHGVDPTGPARWRSPTAQVARLRRAGARHRVRAVRAAGPGASLPGCFVYRTIEDLEAIRAAAAAGDPAGAVVGGGLLGLEAANALRQLGLETHVVEMAPRLMPVQVDEGGGATLRAA